MADVALDPKNSNPKELYGQGLRAFVLQDYETAVRAFSKTSELLSAEHESDTHDSLGDVYLYYGKSLLELSRRESGPLGDGVLKNVEEESETEEVIEEEGEEEKKTDDAKDAEGEVNGDSDKPDEKAEEDSGKTDEVQDAKPEEESTKPEEQTDAEDKKEETTEEAEKKEGESEEDLSDLQVAWEVLELAKSIFTSRGDDGKKNLAETHIILGEISLESGNFSSAIEDILEGLKIQKTIFGNDSRAVAETYYKLGGAYSTNGQIDEAVGSFNSALEYLQNKLENLKKDEEHKETNAEEIEELENLIPEVQEKIADMKNLKVEIANKMTAASVDDAAPKVNGNSEASSSKQVNDISHLVKRKRKDEDAQEEKPAKRPSP